MNKMNKKKKARYIQFPECIGLSFSRLSLERNRLNSTYFVMCLNILLNALKFMSIKRIEVIEVNFNQSEAELHRTSLWK